MGENGRVILHNVPQCCDDRCFLGNFARIPSLQRWITITRQQKCVLYNDNNSDSGGSGDNGSGSGDEFGENGGGGSSNIDDGSGGGSGSGSSDLLLEAITEMHLNVESRAIASMTLKYQSVADTTVSRAIETQFCMFCMRQGCMCYDEDVLLPTRDPLIAVASAPRAPGELMSSVTARIFTFVIANGGGEIRATQPPAYISDLLAVHLARLGFAFNTECTPVRCTACLYAPNVSDLHILFPITGPRYYKKSNDTLTKYLIKLLRYQYRIVIRQDAAFDSSMTDEQIDAMRTCFKWTCEPCITYELTDGLNYLAQMHFAHRPRCVNALHTYRYVDNIVRPNQPIPRLLAMRQLGLEPRFASRCLQ